METHQGQPSCFIILGASGDLAKKKLLPALFSLYCNKMLPEDFVVIGFARSSMDHKAFRNRIVENLTCRYGENEQDCAEKMDQFLDRCYYHSGQYDSTEDFESLNKKINEQYPDGANRLFYMSIPPSIFVKTAKSVGASGIMTVEEKFWSRVVIEKPFGEDTESSEKLLESLSKIFKEEQTYRIDHYLGKEVIQNLLILRFANRIFEPIWNQEHIQYVSIKFTEDIGVEGRAGYFDQYGIIRDVLQNHLMQILALVAMEQPVKFDAESIADEKVKALRSVPALTLDKVTVGQYAAIEKNGIKYPGYHDDPEVPDDSITDTYAHLQLAINNKRWYGVPFYLSAGKALNDRKTEIFIKFKDVPYSIFHETGKTNTNGLLIRVQPNESIEFQMANKVPGLGMNLEKVKLDMLYHDEFDGVLPEAYERLLLDVMRGDRSLFLQKYELQASWDIVTPILHELQEKNIQPKPYPYGSEGPDHGCPA